MIGLKENVIIGKLIPAGTGMKIYRNIKLDSDVNDDDTLDFDDDDFADFAEEVKWNANIQPVSKKRTSDICKEIYSTGSCRKDTTL